MRSFCSLVRFHSKGHPDRKRRNGYHVDSAMEDMLKAAGAVYHLIGDGAKVGNIKDAISGAYEIARALEKHLSSI